MIVVTLLLIIASLVVSCLLSVVPRLVDVVAVVYLLPIMSTLLTWISLSCIQRCLHRLILLARVCIIPLCGILRILLKLILLGWLIPLPLILLALKLQPRCLRLRGRSHIWLGALNILSRLDGVCRIAEDAGVVVAARGRRLLLPLIILLLILQAARILTLLRSKCIFGLWL